jgi:hypothetical protein
MFARPSGPEYGLGYREHKENFSDHGGSQIALANLARPRCFSKSRVGSLL